MNLLARAIQYPIESTTKLHSVSIKLFILIVHGIDSFIWNTNEYNSLESLYVRIFISNNTILIQFDKIRNRIALWRWTLVNKWLVDVNVGDVCRNTWKTLTTPKLRVISRFQSNINLEGCYNSKTGWWIGNFFSQFKN